MIETECMKRILWNKQLGEYNFMSLSYYCALFRLVFLCLTCRVTNARKMLVSHLPNHPPVTLEWNDLNFSVRDSPSRKCKELSSIIMKY